MDCMKFGRMIRTLVEEAWTEDIDSEERRENVQRESAVEAVFPELMIRHAAECPECRSRLELAQLLLEAPLFHPAVPRDLAGRVMDHLEDQQIHPRFAFQHWIPTLAAVAVLAVVLTVVGLRPLQQQQTVAIHFQLEAPEALQVSVVGDWNDWNPTANRLDKRNGLWEGTVKLMPGHEYRYQFFIDERQWVADPRASLNIPDDFGGWSSILQL